MTTFKQTDGFTLIEMVAVIVIAGILAAIAMRTISTSIDNSAHEHTKAELDLLAQAIVGNPAVSSDGMRTDFGYVGDVGSLPPNLSALSSNPGAYATWKGPYIKGSFDPQGFLTDGWGTPYQMTPTAVLSTGSGSIIEKTFATDAGDLMSNSVEGYVVDANNGPPGVNLADSVQLVLRFPDGAGDLVSISANPHPDGGFSFSGVPIGLHELRADYVPTQDSLRMTVQVVPRSTIHLRIVFPTDLW